MHTVALTPAQLAEHLKVKVPAGRSGNVEVVRTRFDEHTVWPRPGPRPKPGIYSELRIGGETWMSDHASEILESLDFLNALHRAPRDSSILMLGLGLGVLLGGAILLLHRGPIDVVEIDADVLALVQPHYEEHARLAEIEVRFHLASAFTWSLPPDARWHLGYADIWRDLTEENLPEIRRLEERFAPRCLWYSSWSRREGEYLKAEREAGRIVPGVPIRER